MITSIRNPRVQAARRLKRRSARDREGAYLVEGAVAVAEALRAGARVREVYLSPGAGALLPEPSRGGDAAFIEVAPHVLEILSDTTTPQGVVAVVAGPAATVEEICAGDLVLVLAGVRDPGNAGTLLRSAVAAGASGAVFTAGSVDAWHPKTVRAAAGALFFLPVARGTAEDVMAGTLKSQGFRLIGTAAEAPTSIYECDLTGKVALVIGNEARGVPENLSASLDEVVSVPMPGPAESLNAAIAGSIVLFEAVRQRAASRAPE